MSTRWDDPPMANAVAGGAVVVGGVANWAGEVDGDVEGGGATDLVGDEEEFVRHCSSPS